MPETTLPRPIEPGEIRVGMRVRLTETFFGDVRTHEFFVRTTETVNGEPVIRSGGWSFVGSDGTWEVLAEAPTPTPAVEERFSTGDGARWISFVRSEGATLLAFCYGSGTHFRADSEGTPSVAYLSSLYGPLTPIPDHGDGCSPWLWDEATDSAWVAGISADSVTHVQVFGEATRLGYLSPQYRSDTDIAARLRPWSERGQVNG